MAFYIYKKYIHLLRRKCISTRTLLRSLPKNHSYSISHITQRLGKRCATDTFLDENGVDAGQTSIVIGR